jgi:uncharacterized membrane protein YbaN (DUF454 family)
MEEEQDQKEDEESDQINIVSNRFVRALLIIAGTIFLGLGVIGIILPILPTTPFLLLAAACYARSSKRFYLWLINNRVFGKYIKNYREGRGIPVRIKVFAISVLWITILISIYFFITNIYIRIILIIIAIAVSAHIILIRPHK